MMHERWKDGLLSRKFFQRSSSERFSLRTEIHDFCEAFELKSHKNLVHLIATIITIMIK